MSSDPSNGKQEEQESQLPPEAFETPEAKEALRKAIEAEIRAKHPRLWEALKADARMFSAARGEHFKFRSNLEAFRSILRLSWRTDAFFGVVLYRLRTRLIARRVPVIPRLLHGACMTLYQINIGEPVVIQPGMYMPHGQVVIDGWVEIGRGATIAPWITIGLVQGDVRGPKFEHHCFVGTGARVLGPVHVGALSTVGANAVVLNDVPPRTTVAGAPARVVSSRLTPEQQERMKDAFRAKQRDAQNAEKK